MKSPTLDDFFFFWFPKWLFFSFLFFFFFFLVFWALPPAFWKFQAWGLIRATAHGNARSLTHWARPGIEHATSWILVGFVNHWATMGTPDCLNFTGPGNESFTMSACMWPLEYNGVVGSSYIIESGTDRLIHFPRYCALMGDHRTYSSRCTGKIYKKELFS